jgi:signal transduction histidine kinase/ligand-binding sensor domain-containing protein/CheY-like chemotaxis protein
VIQNNLFHREHLMAFVLLFLATFIIGSNALGQEEEIQKQLRFRHITIDDGLSNNHVNSICEDSCGYIWMATRNGLNKYNGITFITYYNKAHIKHSLLSNFVNKVFCDSYGNLWIGTNKGLCYYDEYVDGFVKINSHFLGKEIYSVYDLIEDEDQNLWIGTSAGLYKYDLKKREFIKIYHASSAVALPSDSVSCLMMDSRKNLWLSCYNRGFCILNTNTEVLTCYDRKPADNKGLSDRRINFFYEDKSGQVWIATHNGGLCIFNFRDSTFRRYSVDKDNAYTTRVRTIFEDKNGRIFIGTRGGLYVFNPASDKFKLYADSRHKFSTLTNNSVVCSYIDRNNGLWLGTYYGGINYADMESKPFFYYSAGENDPYFMNTNSVFAFARDYQGNLFVGTEDGLNIFDRKSNRFKYLVHQPRNKNSLVYNDIKTLATDNMGNLWIGTNMGGLDYFSPETGRFIHYKHIPGDKTSLLSDKVYHLHVDFNNDLWIITNKDWDELPGQLSLLEDGSRKFKHFRYDFYNCIFENADGDLRIGGMNRIWFYNRENEKFTFVRNDSLLGKVNTVYEDTKGNIWAGSEKGLAMYDPKSKKFSGFTVDNGYPVYVVLGILEDKYRNLWISTNSGLIEFIGIIENQENPEYRIFDKKDGIQSREFNYNAYYKAWDGEMYFGGINGYNSFYPEKIHDNPFKPKIVISELIINNTVVVPGKEINGRIILNEPITKTDQIKLLHKDRVVTLKFDALHYANPEENGYKYILEGFDTEYTLSNAYNNIVTYSELPKGNYLFKVFAANSDGVYSDKPATLRIIVKPSFWQTAGFTILIIIILLSTVLLFVYLRLKNLSSQKKNLEMAVNERTAALNKSNLKLQERQKEIIARNEEIQSQKGEILIQHDEIRMKNEQLEHSYEKIKILSDFGQKLTATLNLEAINDMIYNYVNSLIDTSVFGIGVYDDRSDSILFSRLMENGIPIPEFGSSLDDSTSCAAWCFKNQKIIMSNDFENEYQNFITEMMIRSSNVPKSLIYLPLTVKEKKIGILTVQNYHRNAYSENDLQTLQSLASYIAIALDNAAAYEIVKNQNIELEKHRTELELLVQDRTKDMEKAKERAEESDKLKSAFLANMSHEIRTPLNAIIGFVNLLSEDQIHDDEKKEFYEIIQSNGFSLLNLINDIIDFSKIEAGQLDISFSELNLSKLFDEIYHTYEEELKRLELSHGRSLKIKLNKSHLDKLPVLVSDYVRLKQIFSNLINNAIKFTHHGSIEYGIKEITKDKGIIFYVKDTGIGIDRKNFEIIFDRFRKIEDDKITLYRGAGLGLSITKYLVEKLGGEIWLESEVGKGTVFFFKIPAKTPQVTSGKAISTFTSSGLPIPDWSRKGVLIVEDEASNFMVVESMLKKTKIEVYWAKNGEEAIDLFRKNIRKIDVILMDIKLPKMNGFEVTEEIRKISESVPVIALTAYALPKEEHLIRQEDFDDYMAKPIIRDKLLRVMSQHMKG